MSEKQFKVGDEVWWADFDLDVAGFGQVIPLKITEPEEDVHGALFYGTDGPVWCNRRVLFATADEARESLAAQCELLAADLTSRAAELRALAAKEGSVSK